jgi:hypothetical protein
MAGGVIAAAGLLVLLIRVINVREQEATSRARIAEALEITEGLDDGGAAQGPAGRSAG